MPQMMRRASDRMHLNDVQPRMAKAGIDVNLVGTTGDTVDDAEVLRLIDTAIERAGLKHYALATAVGVKPSQFSGALNGHGHFSVRWLWTFPAEFWAEFLPLVRAEKEEGADARRRRLVQQFTSACNALAQLLTEGVA